MHISTMEIFCRIIRPGTSWTATGRGCTPGIYARNSNVSNWPAETFFSKKNLHRIQVLHLGVLPRLPSLRLPRAPKAGDLQLWRAGPANAALPPLAPLPQQVRPRRGRFSRGMLGGAGGLREGGLISHSQYQMTHGKDWYSEV